MALMLTSNAILALNNGDIELRPVLQIVNIRQIGNAQTMAERFRLVLSDGVNLQEAMLATLLNDKVKNNLAVKGSIVQLLEYICNSVQNRKIIIVLNMKVLESKAEILGDPKHLNAGGERQAALPNPGRRPGLGGVQQQQAPARVSAISSVADAANSGNGFRSAGSGFGQTLGTGLDNGAGGFNMVQAPSGGFNPNASAGVGVKPEPRVSKGATGNAVGVAHGQQGQQQKTFRRPTAYQRASFNGNRGSIVKNEAPATITPIAALNPYRRRWTIKARITAKSDVRRFHNAKGEDEVCSIETLDADGGEIRAPCFNNVVEQFYNRVEVGKVYLITKGSLKAAQKRYNHLKNNWEMFLKSQTTIEPCCDEDSSIPKQLFGGGGGGNGGGGSTGYGGGGGAGGRGGGTCYKCVQPRHFAKDCPTQSGGDGYSGRSSDGGPYDGAYIGGYGGGCDGGY